MNLRNGLENKNQSLSLPKTLTPSQSNYLKTVYQVELTKKVLQKLKNNNKLSDEVVKHLSKRKKKKKKKVIKQKEIKQIKSYSSCQCILKLNNIARAQSDSIQFLLKQKDKLVQENQRLRFYGTSQKAIREAYFIEQIERKNLQILYYQQKIQQKVKKNKQQQLKMQNKIHELQARLQSKTKSKSQQKI